MSLDRVIVMQRRATRQVALLRSAQPLGRLSIPVRAACAIMRPERRPDGPRAGSEADAANGMVESPADAVHGGRLTWEQVYENWESAELQYYWKGHERATVPMVHPTEYK